MNYQLFMQIDEPYAAGFFEHEDRSRFFRLANAQKRYLEEVPLAPYDGGRLYPCGAKYTGEYAVVPEPSYTFWVNMEALRHKSKRAAALISEETALLPLIPSLHTVGGNGFTHGFPNYIRIVTEGLNSYRQRVEQLHDGDFKDGLLAVLNGIEIYRERCLSLLNSSNADARLIHALERVPFLPAENLYEALVCWNFIYYMDGCDDPGALDIPLYSFWHGEDVTDIIAEFYDHVDCNNGWSATLGPQCNELTLQCLRAIQGKRRPSLEFRVDQNTPQ
ncbi:MAG: hypothetical protein KH354_03760, partial [Clostridiales bacterium]|nr:hypothetical protein [Clostridiales bacterium]